ncbi:MAG: sigma 54-interacting transcriptional regulator [Deltaproteobacteria bacterium]|nr:sigma 54-interacting transcriptional regulator [Deltaproteobacteria bacterium]
MTVTTTALRILVDEPGEPEPAVFVLAGDDKIIGRDASADLIVGLASVSGRHGLFRPTSVGYTYVDLGSTNGSALVRGGGGAPEGLVAHQAVPIAPGDTLWLGDRDGPVVVRVEAGVAGFAPAPVGGTVLARAPLADLLGRADGGLPGLAACALAATTPAELAGAARAFLLGAAPRAAEHGVLLHGPEVHAELGTPVPNALRQLARGEGSQVVVLDEGSDTPLPTSGSVAGRGTRAVVLAPLAAGGVAWGCMYASSPLGTLAFPPDLCDALAVAGPLVALAASQLAARRDLEARGAALASENQRLQSGEPEVVGRSPSFVQAVALARQVASADVPVLIQGETGTGKEVLARALHRWSARARGPFVAFNCAAIPDNLLESELFGHVRGAFTGALADRKGLFEEAHGGTVFLDEIGEMPPAMQAKLLRVLQEGEVRRVGASKTSRVDVRVLSATHRDLAAAVAEGRFRADLMYRLNAVTVRLPALRERGDDIALLAHVMLARAQATTRRRVAGFAPDALWALSMHRWPGNVRELDNEILRAVALTPEGEPIRASAFSEALQGGVPAPLAPTRDAAPLPLKEVVARAERLAIEAALERASGNVSEAARLLDMTRPGLYKAMERLGMR